MQDFGRRDRTQRAVADGGVREVERAESAPVAVHQRHYRGSRDVRVREVDVHQAPRLRHTEVVFERVRVQQRAHRLQVQSLEKWRRGQVMQQRCHMRLRQGFGLPKRECPTRFQAGSQCNCRVWVEELALQQ